MLKVRTMKNNPLTPALSPSEGAREKHSPAVRKTERGIFPTLMEESRSAQILFPRPIGWGEGQGEGQNLSINHQLSTIN